MLKSSSFASNPLAWAGVGLATVALLVPFAPTPDARSNPEEAVVALAWGVGMTLAAWWTLSLILCWLAHRTGSQRLVRLSQRVAMPLARRMAQGSLALGLVVVPACGPSTSARPEMVLAETGVSIPTTLTPATTMALSPTQPSLPAVVDVTDDPVDRLPVLTAPDREAGSDELFELDILQTPSNPQPNSTPIEPLTDAEPAADAENPDPTVHVVANGENLWQIAREQLESLSQPSPSKSDIGKYWSEIIAVNRASFTSGNASLIYPGEVIQLPAILK